MVKNHCTMRKTILLSLIVLTCVQGAFAKDISIKSLGAKGDGKTKVTAILQKAIDEVSKSGGGRVIVSGGVYLITPIEEFPDYKRHGYVMVPKGYNERFLYVDNLRFNNTRFINHYGPEDLSQIKIQ